MAGLRALVRRFGGPVTEPAYRSLARDLPLSVYEHLCERVVSLPLNAELTDPEAEQVADAVRAA